MLHLERLDPVHFDWARLDEFDDRVLFQSREWMQFISRTQDSQPIIARVLDGRREVGFFCGQTFPRFGLRLLGSPFPGWTTMSMGFNLRAGASRRAALQALVPFAFDELRCVHFEIKDRRLTYDEVSDLGLDVTHMDTFEVDLSPSDEEMFARLSSACRRAVRKSVKSGVVIEQASGEAFAAEYYDQLREVFARQQLTPSYDVERVRKLICCLEPSGNLLLLRARGPDGTSIATGLFPAMNTTAYFWGGASWREHQIHRPNEAMFWYAMRYWRDRGMTVMTSAAAATTSASTARASSPSRICGCRARGCWVACATPPRRCSPVATAEPSPTACSAPAAERATASSARGAAAASAPPPTWRRRSRRWPAGPSLAGRSSARRRWRPRSARRS